MMRKRFVLYCLVGILLSGAVLMSCQNNNIGGEDAGVAADDASSEKPPVAGLLSLTVMPATATLTVDNVGGQSLSSIKPSGTLMASRIGMSPVKSTG